jgi:hypothetical protein
MLTLPHQLPHPRTPYQVLTPPLPKSPGIRAPKEVDPCQRHQTPLLPSSILKKVMINSLLTFEDNSRSSTSVCHQRHTSLSPTPLTRSETNSPRTAIYRRARKRLIRNSSVTRRKDSPLSGLTSLGPTRDFPQLERTLTMKTSEESCGIS